MMMRWSKNDPVDAVETARNNAVQEVQGNRNPFVDYPGLEDYVWGSKKEVAFSYDNYNGTGGTIIPPDPNRVEDPVFSPMAGTYKNAVNVTLSCTTTGASIVAYLDGMYSTTTTATYVIEAGSGDKPVDGEIALNNTFFGVNWTGSRPSSGADVLTGSENGITITYSAGSSANMYCNSEQIRMYGGNELKIESANGQMVKLEFVTKDSNRWLHMDRTGQQRNIWCCC